VADDELLFDLFCCFSFDVSGFSSVAINSYILVDRTNGTVTLMLQCCVRSRSSSSV